ncbi:MAG: small multi-drug export protein, partial [Archaeoglobaceae archaeon]
LLLNKLLEIAKRFRTLWAIYEFIHIRVERRREIVEKYGYLGLTLFVAIPLPMTGAWTASLLAFLLGLNNLKASIAILLGILIAGIIVLIPTVGVAKLL